MTVRQTAAQERIRAAFKRGERALALRPAIGQGVAATRVRVIDGLACEVEEGPWKLTVDMGPKGGGGGAGPSPGVLGRGALGSCLAMTYVRWAAALGVTFDSLEVEVQADYDARGEYGFEGVSPDYSEVRCVVRVRSPAPEADVRRVLEAAEAHAPYLEVFRRPQAVRRVVRINEPGS